MDEESKKQHEKLVSTETTEEEQITQVHRQHPKPTILEDVITVGAVSSTAGAVSGAISGAITGMALGSTVPIFGTIAGGVLGVGIVYIRRRRDREKSKQSTDITVIEDDKKDD